MLRKPKKTKSREEKTAEEFFPVDEDDLKYTVEKPIKESQIVETVEKQGRKITKFTKPKRTRKSFSRKNKNTTKKTFSVQKEEFKPSNFKLKESGYELIITEKPQAALKIASSLGDSKKLNLSGVPYYEVNRQGRKLVIGCAVGHLFTLKQNNSNGAKLPIFDISWTPNYIARKGDFTKKYYDVLLKLAKSAGSLTVATDYDVEGEVIGLNIVRLIAGQQDASRMKFSTLTESELNKAYENKSPTLNWGQGLAGETRHYLDWFYGINLSRALMNSIKTTGGFKIMSIGRVQGPALKLIVDKEKQILSFKPTPYWQVFILINDGKNKLELKYIKDLAKKTDLKKFENLKEKTINVITKKTEQIIPPQEPFNLTTLQTESYKFFGFTPSRTLQIAQSLYLAGIISYPRTSSQKLPSSINYKEILEKVAHNFKVGQSKLTRNKPIEGKKSDPAHPSIYPTGQLAIMNSDEEKLYGLIAKRFISLFCDDAIIDNKSISGEIDNLRFSTRGSEIRKKGWMDIYPSKFKETQLPDMNGPCSIENVRNEEKMTQPPHRYSPASIITELEKKNLGTKATRASIIETLYDRGYIKERAIEATPLGISLINTLEKYSPIIIDEKLTRHFEREMEELQENKKLEKIKAKEQIVIDEAKKAVTEIIYEFEQKEEKIGKELVQATQEARELEKEANILMPCPVCNKGSLAITYSPKFKRQFIACNAYPDCKTTFSLPPNGIIKKVEDKNESDGLKKCEHCKFPVLMSLRAGKKPWIFCFNLQCPSNKERIEEYKKKKENLENKENKEIA